MPLPRDTPQCGSEEIVDSIGRRLSLESREPFGSAGKEATVAPSGVVLNAA
jgi:hypothetical protein